MRLEEATVGGLVWLCSVGICGSMWTEGVSTGVPEDVGGAGTRTPPTLVLVDLLLLSVLLLPLDAVALLADWACCCFFFFRGMMVIVRWLDSVVVIVVVIVGWCLGWKV